MADLPIGLLDEIALSPSRGRKAAELDFSVSRVLGPEDILAANTLPVASETPGIGKLRSIHHELARALAAGAKQVQAAHIVGMSQSRISILMNDPSFRDLVAYYGAQAEQEFIDLHKRIAQMGLASTEELITRLEETPGDFSTRELAELTELAAKHSGGKGSAGPGGVNIEINFVKPEAAPAPKSIVIDHGAVTDLA